ncbi:MAG TPA: dihydroorotate dehydrogenase electron transfer subunit, partial [Mariprofundaceae bacterium]|nr:dihydroorotate dehydrogenase electron transfer subunit [Mariprofundaceae bacterium]
MKNKRNTVFEEQAEVLANVSYDGEQCIMRLKAPKTAQSA